MDAYTRYMTMRPAFPKGENIPNSLVEQLVPRYKFSQDTGELSPAMLAPGQPLMGKPGESPLNWTRPPREPVGQIDTFIGTDSKGSPVYHGQSGQYTIDPLGKHIVFTGALGAKPTNKANAGQIPPAIINNLSKIRQKLESSKGFFHKSGDDAIRSSFNQTASDALGYAGLSPEAHSLAVMVLNDPDSDMVPSSAIAQRAGERGISPEEIPAFQQALTKVRGR